MVLLFDPPSILREPVLHPSHVPRSRVSCITTLYSGSVPLVLNWFHIIRAFGALLCCLPPSSIRMKVWPDI